MGILQVFDRFFEDVPTGVSPEPGHIYWAPTPNVDEVPRILDIERASPTEHEVSRFEIKQIEGHHFTNRQRLPIRMLNLGDTEELLISKAKKRPVVILASTVVNDVNALPNGTQRRLARALSKVCYLVAPMYSTSSMMAPGTFGPALVARIRALQYLHLFCLPHQVHSERPGSIVRLDRIFPTHLGRGCSPMGKKIHDEPFEILLSQFSMLTGAVYREPYDLVKELVQDALPEEIPSRP